MNEILTICLIFLLQIILNFFYSIKFNYPDINVKVYNAHMLHLSPNFLFRGTF